MKGTANALGGGSVQREADRVVVSIELGLPDGEADLSVLSGAGEMPGNRSRSGEERLVSIWDVRRIDRFSAGGRRESKKDCEYHGWLKDGRPEPPAGYCGDSCRMRPRRINGGI